MRGPPAPTPLLPNLGSKSREDRGPPASTAQSRRQGPREPVAAAPPQGESQGPECAPSPWGRFNASFEIPHTLPTALTRHPAHLLGDPHCPSHSKTVSWIPALSPQLTSGLLVQPSSQRSLAQHVLLVSSQVPLCPFSSRLWTSPQR